MAISSFLTFVISSVELLGRCASYFVEHIMAISHAASFQVLTFGYSTASCSLHLVTLWRLVLLVTSHDVGCYFTPEASLRRFSSGHVHRGDFVHLSMTMGDYPMLFRICWTTSHPVTSWDWWLERASSFNWHVYFHSWPTSPGSSFFRSSSPTPGQGTWLTLFRIQGLLVVIFLISSHCENPELTCV